VHHTGINSMTRRCLLLLALCAIAITGIAKAPDARRIELDIARATAPVERAGPEGFPGGRRPGRLLRPYGVAGGFPDDSSYSPRDFVHDSCIDAPCVLAKLRQVAFFL
jgi:hypothetical protein